MDIIKKNLKSAPVGLTDCGDQVYIVLCKLKNEYVTWYKRVCRVSSNASYFWGNYFTPAKEEDDKECLEQAMQDWQRRVTKWQDKDDTIKDLPIA